MPTECRYLSVHQEGADAKKYWTKTSWRECTYNPSPLTLPSAPSECGPCLGYHSTKDKAHRHPLPSGAEGGQDHGEFLMCYPCESLWSLLQGWLQEATSRNLVFLTLQICSGLPENRKERGRIYMGLLILPATILWQELFSFSERQQHCAQSFNVALCHHAKLESRCSVSCFGCSVLGTGTLSPSPWSLSIWLTEFTEG